MSGARILFLDIETAPAKVFSWGIYEQDIPINHIIDYPHLLCWSAKWAGEREIMSDALIYHKKAYARDSMDDSQICRSAWALLDECDVAVAHNGDDFDIKRLNSYFLKAGLRPPSPFKTVDTKKVARSNFGFISNKLDSLCQELEIGAKMQHSGMKLWRDCMAGEPKAWATMVRYNRKDVMLLEELYRALLPYMKNHPLTSDRGNCQNCGSGIAEKRGFLRLLSGKFQRLQCVGCGAWRRGPKMEMAK